MSGTSRGRRRLGVVLVFPLLTAIVGAVSPALPAIAQSRESITYEAAAEPLKLSLCVGESAEITVLIFRMVERPSENIGWQVAGGRVVGVISDEQIGHFDPADVGRDVAAPPEARAVFKFVAESPGSTHIDFVIKDTGEEANLGGGWPQRDATVQVEVTDCYEASTSGLATKFVMKDMGGLNKPFLLTGYTPVTNGVTTESQYFYFIPNPQDHLHGGYAFVDTANTMLGGAVGKCVVYVGGGYDVVFHLGANARPVEGDLQMKGSGVAVCGAFSIPITYTSAAGFEILFKPKTKPAP